MSNDQRTVAEIHTFLRSNQSVANTQVQGWIESNDESVYSGVLHVLLNASNRIEPGFGFREYGDILLRAALGVIVSGNKDDEPEFSYTDYQAAEVIRWWFLECYNRRGSEPEAEKCLESLSRVLAKIYETENGEVQDCIVNGIIEHLFENEDLQKYFDFWKSTPSLAEAYDAAKQWSTWIIEEKRFVLEIANRLVQKLKAQGRLHLRVLESPMGSTRITVQWTLQDGVTEQKLRILSFLHPNALSRSPEIFDGIIKYVSDEKNWDSDYGQKNAFLVRIPAHLGNVAK